MNLKRLSKPLAHPLRIKVIPGAAILLFIIVFLTSCWKDHFDFENLQGPDNWNPDVCAPLVNTKLNLKDILNDYDYNNLFVEDATQFLYLVYWNKVYSQTAAEMFSVPDQSISQNLQLDVPGPTTLWGDYILPPITTSFSFVMPQNEKLDRIVLNAPGGGLLEFYLDLPGMNHEVRVNISIPTATRNGIPFSCQLDFSPGAAISQTLDLSGYEIVLNNTPPNSNSLEIIFRVTVRGTGNPNNSPYSFNLNTAFRNISFHALYGDFGQRALSMPWDTVDIKLFSNNVLGHVEIINPAIHLWAYNSFGLPAGISMNNLRAVSAVNAPYSVNITGYPNPWYITAPSLTEIGQVSVSHFMLDNVASGGALNTALQMSPQQVIVEMEAQANPAGGPSQNFVIDTSRIALDMQIELPLYGRAWNFCLADTLDFEFNTDMDFVDFISFRINTNNGFPVDAAIQIYFLDEGGSIIDSLFASNEAILLAPPVGPAPASRVLAPAAKLTTATVEQPRLMRLEAARKIVFFSALQTVSNGTQPVKIYSDYSLEFNLSARAKFKVNL